MKVQAPAKFMELLKGVDPRVLPFIWGGALVAFLLIDILLVLGPQWRWNSDVNVKTAQMATDIKTLTENRQRMDQLIKERDKLIAQVSDVQLKIHPADELPKLLYSIGNLAVKAGVQLNQIAPYREGQKLLLQNGDGKYYSIPVILEGSSGFRKFGKLLSLLERDHIFWQTDSFSFEADPLYVQKNQVRFLMQVVVLEK